jgi:hypothetical protein
MEVSEAKRLRALEDENAKLKRMLADAMLDNPTRKHARNGMLSPVEFERQHNAKAQGV